MKSRRLTARLEINIHLFRRAQARCVTFRLITTILPQVLGTAYGLAFGYAIIPAVVIGSLHASHTLISLPIVTRLGVMSLEPVVVTIGATLVSDTLSLAIAGRALARQARLTMWALTQPQVAATLAVTLVGYNTVNAAGVRLLDENTFNAVLVLLVVTSVLGPILTQRFASDMDKQEARAKMAAD